MITSTVQRWRDRRDTYRPKGETINTMDYEVAALLCDRIPKAFVLQHHYAGCYPAARHRYGLYRGETLVGVAVFSQAMANGVLKPLPGDPADSVELGRFVLLDDVPANGESWFLARTFELLRTEGLVGVVSFSDPMPRDRIDGRIVFGGHVGTIYQAFNAHFLGRGSKRTIRLLPDGTVLSARAMSKIRKRERGFRYSAALLERFGVPPLAEHEDSAAWLRRAIDEVTRKRRHPGNYKYVWTLHKRDHKHLLANIEQAVKTLRPTATHGHVARQDRGTLRHPRARVGRRAEGPEEERRTDTMKRQLSPEQRAAMLAYIAENGKAWKQKLSLDWSFARARVRGELSPELQQIRNTFGPTWLRRISLRQIREAGGRGEEEASP